MSRSVVILSFLIFGLVNSHFSSANRRSKRYLIYPDGGPARAQFILGLGIPVDLKEQSVTVGAVFKFQYDLPNNSTEYTSRIYGFANTASRGMDEDVSNIEVNNEPKKLYNAEEFETNRDVDNYTTKVFGDEDDEKNVLIDINFYTKDENRKSRSLINLEYENNNYLSSNYKLSLDEAIRRQEMIDNSVDEEYTPKRANRWDYYKIIENMVERYGYSGRPCLLRTICEAAEVPFTYQSGLLAEIGHVLFTPSTTKDELSHHSDNEYHAAERLGQEHGVDCETLFPECELSILDTFTQIGMDTLHKFGFDKDINIFG